MTTTVNLGFRANQFPPIAGMEGKRVIYMNTFSKTLAPSIRIAYMVLPDELMDKFNTKLGFIPILCQDLSSTHWLIL